MDDAKVINPEETHNNSATARRQPMAEATLLRVKNEKYVVEHKKIRGHRGFANEYLNESHFSRFPYLHKK